MDHSPVIAISVGEAFGGSFGTRLTCAIKQRCPDARFIDTGDERMKAEGSRSLRDQKKLAVHDFVGVAKRLFEVSKIRRGLVNDLIRIKPDVFVGIDAPDSNLGVAKKPKKVGILTVHYISPSMWAWRCERVNKIAHQVNRVLCLSPTELQLYFDAGGEAEFAGHPTAQTMPLDDDRAAARAKLGVADEAVVFVLLSGGRASEINYMAPLFFQTALSPLRHYPQA